LAATCLTTFAFEYVSLSDEAGLAAAGPPAEEGATAQRWGTELPLPHEPVAPPVFASAGFL